MHKMFAAGSNSALSDAKSRPLVMTFSHRYGPFRLGVSFVQAPFSPFRSVLAILPFSTPLCELPVLFL